MTTSFARASKLLEEVDAEKQSLLMAVLQIFQPLAQRLELRVGCMFPKAPRQLDRDFLRLLLRIGIPEHGLQQFGVQDQSIEIVPHGIHMDVLVDELDGFGSEPVPQQSAGPRGRLQGFVHLRQPAIVCLVLRQNRIRRQRLPRSVPAR